MEVCTARTRSQNEGKSNNGGEGTFYNGLLNLIIILSCRRWYIAYSVAYCLECKRSSHFAETANFQVHFREQILQLKEGLLEYEKSICILFLGFWSCSKKGEFCWTFCQGDDKIWWRSSGNSLQTQEARGQNKEWSRMVGMEKINS